MSCKSRLWLTILAPRPYRWTLIALQPADELAIDLSSRSGGLVTRQDRSLEHLRKYLRHFRLDSWIKAEIEAQWPRLAAGQLDLRAFRALSAGQASALQDLIVAKKEAG